VLEPIKPDKFNPLDSQMTKSQVVRRKFNASRPRVIQNRRLSKFEAMARTMELFDKLRDAQREAGLEANDVVAGLVFAEHGNIVRTFWLPVPERINEFVKKVMELKDPMFLGVLFGQKDPDAVKEEKQATAFLWPFVSGPLADKQLLAARQHFAKGGHKALDN
jgi:hypothetical protein